jgi:hypothetical protein
LFIPAEKGKKRSAHRYMGTHQPALSPEVHGYSVAWIARIVPNVSVAILPIKRHEPRHGNVERAEFEVQ